MIHVLGGTEQDGIRVHHATQNSSKRKTYELFISAIFYFIFSEHSWPWVTETRERKPSDKGQGEGTTMLIISLDCKLWRKIAGVMMKAEWTFCMWQSSWRHEIGGDLCLDPLASSAEQSVYDSLFSFRWHRARFNICSVLIFSTSLTELYHCLRGSQMS